MHAQAKSPAHILFNRFLRTIRLLRVQTAPCKVADFDFRLEHAESERSAAEYFGSHRELMSLAFLLKDAFVVDPRSHVVIVDAHSKAVPFLVLEVAEGARRVL